MVAFLSGADIVLSTKTVDEELKRCFRSPLAISCSAHASLAPLMADGGASKSKKAVDESCGEVMNM
jgi:hypothetical protein